jgi:hypothetical protein
MSHKIKTAEPPPIMPGLRFMPTNQIVTDEKGKRYKIVKLERMTHSDVNYTVKRQHAA